MASGEPKPLFSSTSIAIVEKLYTVNPLKKVSFAFIESNEDTDRRHDSYTYLRVRPKANFLRRNSMSSQKVKNDSEFSPLQPHSRSDVAFYQFRDVTVGMKRKVSENTDGFRPENVKCIRCDKSQIVPLFDKWPVCLRLKYTIFCNPYPYNWKMLQSTGKITLQCCGVAKEKHELFVLTAIFHFLLAN